MVCRGGCDISIMCFFVVKLKFMVISCEKMHMISILVRYGFRWHSDKPYRTRLRLVRYGLSECHLNPYRTRMDTICISYTSQSPVTAHPPITRSVLRVIGGWAVTGDCDIHVQFFVNKMYQQYDGHINDLRQLMS